MIKGRLDILNDTHYIIKGRLDILNDTYCIIKLDILNIHII